MTFSNISSEMSPEETGSEAQEIAESPEVQEGAAQLEQATFEPEAAVELDNSHQEAEVVEAAFTETMQAVETSNAKDAELIPENDNAPGEEVMIDTFPLPEKPSDRVAIIDFNDSPRDAVANNLRTASDEVSATPITLPGQAREGGQGGRPGGGVEATPINLPNPQDEISATPITLPGQAREIEQQMDSVSIIDTNDGPRIAPDGMDDVAIIDSNDGPRRTVDNNLHAASEEISATPITLPGQEREGGQGGRPGGGVEATPINLPNPQDEISATPITLPGQGIDEVSATPITLPGQGKEASLDGKGDDRVAIGTWPTPERKLDDIAIIDSNDGPRLGDDRVKIDTVPLPEDGLDGVAIIDTNDGPRSAVDDGPRLGDDRVMIDTVPLPEDDLDGVAIIDSNDNPRTPLDDRLRDDLRMAEQGYMGEVTTPKGGEIPETGVGDPLGGITGALDGSPGEVDDPFDSIPEWGETADGQSLADAAAPGADTRAGISTVRAVTGWIWDKITTDSGNDTGAGGGGGVRGTPDPESGEGGDMPELVVGGKVIGVSPGKELNPSGQPLNYGKSMMQPIDEEGKGREGPVMKMSAEELRDAQLNPYIQNTDEHVDVLPGSRDDMTNPKDWLIDNDLEPFAPGAGGGGTNPLAKPSTNNDAPPPPPPGGGKPGVSMDQAGDLVSSKPPDGGDGKPPDGADQVFKPSTNDDAPPPPPPGGGKPGVSMDQAGDLLSSKPPDGGDGKPPDGADLNLLNGLENSLSPDTAPADLSSMMDEGTMLNANENKDLKDLDETNTQNLAPTDGKL